MEKVQCNGKAYLVDRANRVVYDFEDGLNEVLDPEPVRARAPSCSLLLSFLRPVCDRILRLANLRPCLARCRSLARLAFQVGAWDEESKTIELYAVTQDPV